MPEEVVIILAILIGAIWLLVKIFQAVDAALGRAMKSGYEAVARRKENRYTKRRDGLRQFVHVLIPNELDRFEKKFEFTRIEFEDVQRLTNWVPHPPTWEKEEFQPLTRPCKSSRYSQMCIDDIDAILSPSAESTTWSAKESEITSRQCKYPFVPPATKLEEFILFSTLNPDLQMAVFETDAGHIRDKDVARYFSDEQSKVLTYNYRRANLIKRTVSLNSAIEEWNRQNRISWESYVAESQWMEHTELVAFQRASEVYTKACKDETSYFKRLLEGHKKGEKQSVLERLDYVLDKVTLPGSVPHTWDIDFDEEQKIVVIEIGLPDVVHQPPLKTVILKSGTVKKNLNQTERTEIIPKIHPAILLRTAYEVFRNDTKTIALLVVNGWVSFDDPATGTNTKAYTASLMVERDQIKILNLTKLDPLVAFENLHGKSAGRLIEIIPIEPMLSLNRKDSRFVNAKAILSGLGPETNLAAMDWQDFEHLIRELFEKEFSGRGAEVKITQASRDRGVDAVVFDPDPIHGGKYIIQAKRYTNTVDVSSVRDLCAVVQKEGASRGILVTTSTYGADAYAFANNEPITLLNGAELLGLLKKHGYTFRINLQEARRLHLGPRPETY
jgi:restriction system protein